MMIGFLTGRDDMEMFPQYQRAMGHGNKLYTKFRDEFGTVNCSEIQKLDSEEREQLHRRMEETGAGCQSVTSAGARLAGEVIIEILEQGLPLPRMLAQGK